MTAAADTQQPDFRKAVLFAKEQFQKFFKAMNAKDYKMAGMHVMDAETRLTALLLPSKDSGKEPTSASNGKDQPRKLLPPEPTAAMVNAVSEAQVKHRIVMMKKGQMDTRLPFHTTYEALYQSAPTVPSAPVTASAPAAPAEAAPPPGWKKFLLAMEWYEVEHDDQNETWQPACPSCRALQSAGHESDCELAALLKAASDK